MLGWSGDGCSGEKHDGCGGAVFVAGVMDEVVTGVLVVADTLDGLC